SLHLKGGLVLEDELVALFGEALHKVEPLANDASNTQLHEAVSEYRQQIERLPNPEHALRDRLQDTLSECFESAYEKLSPWLNEQRVSKAMDLGEQQQQWPDEAKDPQQATCEMLT